MKLLSLTGVLAGVLYGYFAERGDFCLATGFAHATDGRDFSRLRALLIAIAVQMLVVPLLFLTGLATPGLPACYPLGALLGGLLFGVSLRWAGGCSVSVFHRAGAGQLRALASLVGVALGAGLLELGPVQGLRALVQAQLPELGRWDLAAVLGIPLSLVSPLCGALLLGAAWRDSAVGVRASWRRTGLAIGGVASLGWALSALCARDYGLSELPGLLGLLRVGTHGVPPRGAFDLLFVLALPLGGFLASRRSGSQRWLRPDVDDAWQLSRFVLGGVGLGAGASLAAGGSLGHVITGVPLLATGSVLAFSSMLIGAWLGALRR